VVVVKESAEIQSEAFAAPHFSHKVGLTRQKCRFLVCSAGGPVVGVRVRAL